MITYQYALSDDGSAKHISEVTDDYRKNHLFSCYGCGNRLSAVLGNKREIHFRHCRDCVCSKETYLHQLGKKLFVELYENNKRENKSLTINTLQKDKCNTEKCYLGRKITCTHNVFKLFDLLPRYTYCEIEKYDDETGLRPDVLLSDDDGNKIYIEIAVFHLSTDEKKKTGIPIVEFYIDEEDDLDIFRFSEQQPITDLGHQNYSCFNFDCFVENVEPFCFDIIKNAKRKFKEFYQKQIYLHHSLFIQFPCSSECERKCKILEKGKCVCEKEYSERDLTELFKECIDRDESSPDLYLVGENGAYVRINFSIWLFDDEAFLGNERVIQFALGGNGDEYIWECEKSISQNECTKFFNFKKGLSFKCEEQWFDGAFLYKNGRCVPIVDMNIVQVLEFYLERKHAISEYILIPSNVLNPDSWLGAPVIRASKDVYKTITAVFLKNRMWVKNCNLCAFCRDNWRKFDGGPPIYCYRHRKTCRAGDAVVCDDFQISDENIRGLTKDEHLVNIIIEAWKTYRLKEMK